MFIITQLQLIQVLSFLRSLVFVSKPHFNSSPIIDAIRWTKWPFYSTLVFVRIHFSLYFFPLWPVVTFFVFNRQTAICVFDIQANYCVNGSFLHSQIVTHPLQVATRNFVLSFSFFIFSIFNIFGAVCRSDIQSVQCIKVHFTAKSPGKWYI